MSKNRSKIVSKMVANTRKSSLGAVLEHFGEPLGAKMAQERQQERKSMKNVEFMGRPGLPKWNQNRSKKSNDFFSDFDGLLRNFSAHSLIFFALG